MSARLDDLSPGAQMLMRNGRMPNINHAGHDHADTSAARAQCRAERREALQQEVAAWEATQEKEAEVKRGRPSTAKKGKIDLDSMQYLVESLSMTSEALTGVSEVDVIVAKVRIDGVSLRLQFKDGRWTIEGL